MTKYVVFNDFSFLDDKSWINVPLNTIYTYSLAKGIPVGAGDAGYVTVRRFGGGGTIQELTDDMGRKLHRARVGDQPWGQWAG